MKHIATVLFFITLAAAAGGVVVLTAIQQSKLTEEQQKQLDAAERANCTIDYHQITHHDQRNPWQ